MGKECDPSDKFLKLYSPKVLKKVRKRMPKCPIKQVEIAHKMCVEQNNSAVNINHHAKMCEHHRKLKY